MPLPWNIFMEIFNYKEVPSIGKLKHDILSVIRPESKRFFKIHDPVGFFSIERSQMVSQLH